MKENAKPRFGDDDPARGNLGANGRIAHTGFPRGWSTGRSGHDEDCRCWESLTEHVVEYLCCTSRACRRRTLLVVWTFPVSEYAGFSVIIRLEEEASLDARRA